MRALFLLTITATAAFGFAYSSAAWAEEIVVDDAGREIRLNSDGTWVRASPDRFATTASGERVRIRADGTWVVTGKALSQPAPATQNASFQLARVEIFKKRTKRSKGSHTDTRTVYTLRVANNSSWSLDLQKGLEGKLRAQSSRGEQYPIMSITYANATIPPNGAEDLTIVADGSPQWYGVKHLSLEIDAGTFGNSQPHRLTKHMDEVIRTNTDALR